jgi:hypothetical protein
VTSTLLERTDPVRPRVVYRLGENGHARVSTGEISGSERATMTMWDYQTDLGAGSLDLVGYDVEATDGSIGKVDEASNAAGSAFLVVDTGFWIFGKKRMIPAGVVDRVDDVDKRVFVRLTKDQIKSAPDFEEQHRSERDQYDEYYDTYR